MLRVAALILLLTTAAQAEGPGRYEVHGSDTDGSSYTGTLTLSQTGKNTWSLNWRVGRNSYFGFGVGDGRVIAVSYSGAGAPGVISYVANGTGGYDGTWATAGDRVTGTERLVPQ